MKKPAVLKINRRPSKLSSMTRRVLFNPNQKTTRREEEKAHYEIEKAHEGFPLISIIIIIGLSIVLGSYAYLIARR